MTTRISTASRLLDDQGNDASKTDKPAEGDGFFENELARQQEKEALLKAMQSNLTRELWTVKDRLTKVVLAINDRDIKSERVSVQPSILLFAFPYLVGDEKKLQMHVWSMDKDNLSEPYEKLLDEFRRLPHFPVLGAEDEQSIGEYRRLVNLVKGLTVFAEEALLLAEKDPLVVDFGDVEKIIDESPFFPPRQIRAAYETYRIGGKQIVIDEMKLLQFKTLLGSYFSKKGAQVAGVGRKHSSMSNFPMVNPELMVSEVRGKLGHAVGNEGSPGRTGGNFESEAQGEESLAEMLHRLRKR